MASRDDVRRITSARPQPLERPGAHTAPDGPVPAILVRLDRIGPDGPAELITEARPAQAPKRLTKGFLGA
jgi:hypothetical protein